MDVIKTNLDVFDNNHKETIDNDEENQTQPSKLLNKPSHHKMKRYTRRLVEKSQILNYHCLTTFVINHFLDFTFIILFRSVIFTSHPFSSIVSYSSLRISFAIHCINIPR